MCPRRRRERGAPVVADAAMNRIGASQGSMDNLKQNIGRTMHFTPTADRGG